MQSRLYWGLRNPEYLVYKYVSQERKDMRSGTPIFKSSKFFKDFIYKCKFLLNILELEN